MITRSTRWCIVPFLLLAGQSDAQTCLGRLDFGHQPTQMLFEGTFADSFRGFGIGGAAGGTRGFGGFSLGVSDFDRSDDTFIGLSGFGGGQVHAGRVSICPIGGLAYISGHRNFGGSFVGDIRSEEARNVFEVDDPEVEPRV